MKKKNKYDNSNLSALLAGLMFIAGLLLGSVISGIVMLLLAPQSGRKTRRQIRRKGRDLREQTTETIEEGVAQVRAKASQVSASLQHQAEALQKRGQGAVDEGKQRLAAVVEDGKTAVNGA